MAVDKRRLRIARVVLAGVDRVGVAARGQADAEGGRQRRCAAQRAVDAARRVCRAPAPRGRGAAVGALQARECPVQCGAGVLRAARGLAPPGVVALEHAFQAGAVVALAVGGGKVRCAKARCHQAAHQLVSPDGKNQRRGAASVHGAVKPLQLGLRRRCQRVAGRGAAQPGQQAHGGLRMLVVLQRLQAGCAVQWLLLQLLRNALVAVGQGPVAGQKRGVAGRGDALVGGGQPARLATVAARQVGHRQPALPVVARQPARGRCHAAQVVVRVAQRHAAHGAKTRGALRVGGQHALHGRVVGFQRFPQLAHGLRLVDAKTGQHGLVVTVQRGPAQRQYMAVQVNHLGMAGLRVAQHRPVAGAAQAQLHIGLAFDAHGFQPHGKRRPAVRRAVAASVLRVDLLQVQVLHIGVGVGKTPGHAGGAPQHHKRQARQRGAQHVQRRGGRAVRRLAGRRLQVRHVPDGGCAQAQVRVVRQQRLARGGARAVQHPVVAALALAVAGAACQRLGPALQAAAVTRQRHRRQACQARTAGRCGQRNGQSRGSGAA